MTCRLLRMERPRWEGVGTLSARPTRLSLAQMNKPTVCAPGQADGVEDEQGGGDEARPEGSGLRSVWPGRSATVVHHEAEP